MCSGPSVAAQPAAGSGSVSTRFDPAVLADLDTKRNAVLAKLSEHPDNVYLRNALKGLDKKKADYTTSFRGGGPDALPPAPTAPGVFAPKITQKTGADALRGIPTISIPTR